MTSISILKEMFKLLFKNDRLTDLVGNKIYPVIANEDTTFPFITFNRDSVYTEYCKDGRVLDNVTISFNIASTSYEESVEIAEEVRNAIECKRIDNINMIRLTSVSEDFVENTYIQQLQFTCNFDF